MSLRIREEAETYPSALGLAEMDEQGRQTADHPHVWCADGVQ
jgi:hypothetical protein